MKARQWALQHVVNKDLIASPPRFRGLGTWEGRLQLSASRPTGVGMAQVLLARHAIRHSQGSSSRRLISSPPLEEWGSLHGMEL